MSTEYTPEQLANEEWRLNNLYKVKDENGKVVSFVMNRHQRFLYGNMWYLNLILKARQLGFTTFIQIFILDRCLFQPNTSAGVIAHTREDAKKFFKHKIKFAYDNLPEEIKRAVPANTDSASEITFGNGSSITVGTSMRSGTLQYLHVSEFGKSCAKYPEKARETITGSLNTVHAGNFIFIESTAEGRGGPFFDMCQEARKMLRNNSELTPLDYKFFFFPWQEEEDYQLPMMLNEPIPEEFTDYFESLKERWGIELTAAQKHWYIKKAAQQGDDMKREFPAHPDEAFEQSLKGAIFGEYVQEMRNDHRICQVPFERGVPVNTFWDLGHNDINAIWFHQRIGAWDHFIDYYEDRLMTIDHYIGVMEEKGQKLGYRWGTFYLPHDGKTKHIEAVAGSVKDILKMHGFRVRVVERTPRKIVSIQDTRRQFSHCRIDRKNCDDGLWALENYMWVWDENNETYKKEPIHNKASNGADAFQTYGFGYSGDREDYLAGVTPIGIDKPPPAGYGGAQRVPRKTHRYGHIV